MPNVDCFFVVDIGTRFVRGLLCTTKQAEDSLAHDPMKLHVIECEVLEHETRAMLAGHCPLTSISSRRTVPLLLKARQRSRNPHASPALR